MKEPESKKPNNIHKLLEQIGDVVLDEQNIDSVLSEIVNLIQSILEVPRCSIMLADSSGKYLNMIAAAGIPKKLWSEIKVEFGKGFSGKVAETGQPMLVFDIASEDKKKTSPNRYKTNSFICAPMKKRGKVIGVINVNDKNNGEAFTRKDLETIVTLSNFIALTLENTHLLIEAKNRRQNLRNIFDELFVGLITITPKKKIKHINRFAGELLEIPNGVNLDLDLRKTFDDNAYNEISNMLQSTIESNAAQSHRMDYLKIEKKKVIPLVLTTTLVYREDKEIESVMFIIEDHTLQKEVRELRRMDEIKSNFIAMISHELRTPLTSIKGAAHILISMMNDGLDDSQINMMKVISQNTERLITQINNMLDVTYIETNTVQLTRRPTNLLDLINSIRPKFDRIAKEKNIDLKYNFHQDTIFADVDIDKFNKIMENLLDNSLKFTHEEGHIWVDVDINHTDCEIRIKDTGVGIPQKDCDHIFEKFIQADQSSTREFGGSGLGLFITKAFVELHGGKISMLETSDKGTEFCITLPRYVEAEVNQEKVNA